MSWGAVGSAAIGAVGGALGGGKDGPDAHDILPPWLHQDWQQLGGQIVGLETPEYYGGQLIADQNPWLQNALGGMAGWQDGIGQQLMGVNALGGIGAAQEGMRGGLDYLSELRSMESPFQYNQGVFDQTMGNLMPGLQGQFDAATRDINRDLNWSTLPGIDMAGVGAGHMGSTKVGQMGALATGMAQDRAGDIGSALYTNAANQAHGAAMDAGRMNLDFAGSMVDDYGSFSELGNRYMGSAYDMGVGNLGMGFDAGNYQQNYDQSRIGAEMDKWNFNEQAPWTALSEQLRMLMSQSSNPAPNTGMSPWEGAMNGINAGLGIYGMGQDMGWWGSGGVNGANTDLDGLIDYSGLF